MTQHAWRIAADVTGPVRQDLLRLFQPRFHRLYLHSITWAYGVSADYPFDPAPQDCTLTGLHDGPGCQAFTLQVAGSTRRPDGKPLFLCFCTSDDVRPAAAGHIVPAAVVPITPYTFGIELRRYPVWQQTPTLVRA